MLKAKINASPPAPAVAVPKSLRPGQLVKLIQAKAPRYGSPPPKNSILLIRAKTGRAPETTLSLEDVATGENYAATEETSIFSKLTKTEAAEYRERIKQRLLDGQVKAYTSTGYYAGTDPEVFVVDEQGEVIPAFAFLPAKKEGLPVPCLGGRYPTQDRLFWDGFQAEFTTTATYCIARLMDDVRQGLKTTLEQAQKKYPQARLTPQCVVETPQAMLAACPPEGVLLGCAPSYNAYFEGMNPALERINPMELPYRFAGCHVHIGCGAISQSKAKKIVKVIDQIAGVASVALFRGLEDSRRRQFYGLAGEFRLPSHGLEYRVLSSLAIAHPVLTHLCFDLVRMAFVFGFKGHGFAWDSSDAETQQAINQLDVELALQLLERNRPVLKRLLKDGYSQHVSLIGHGLEGSDKDRAAPKAERLIFEGADKLVNTTDMVDNWKLTGSWESHSDRDRVSLANWKL